MRTRGRNLTLGITLCHPPSGLFHRVGGGWGHPSASGELSWSCHPSRGLPGTGSVLGNGSSRLSSRLGEAPVSITPDFLTL